MRCVKETRFVIGWEYNIQEGALHQIFGRRVWYAIKYGSDWIYTFVNMRQNETKRS